MIFIDTTSLPEVLMFENMDLEHVISPVDVDKLEFLLNESNYDSAKTEFLINGFRNGFSIGYDSDKCVHRTAPNLKLEVGNETILWNKVMKEVKEKRYAGPFEKIPFEYYIQSPIGLVPKDGGKDVRLIFHLSYPRTPKSRTAESVNANTPQELCTVKYKDFDLAVKRCLEEGIYCSIGKSDMRSAFRNLGIRKRDWVYLLMKATNPLNGRTYFFVDKCLPFRASISCAVFQAFSDAVAHLVEYKTKKPLVNYLDDYLFIHRLAQLCNMQIEVFLDVCKEINFPVSMEKTFWANDRMVFLGLLLDTVNQLILIPREKILKGRDMLSSALARKSWKITLKDPQKLTGFLNFLCRAIVPGRVFMRRLYAFTKGILKPHHHIRITEEMRLDLLVWWEFLHNPAIFVRSFADFDSQRQAVDIELFSDASRNFELGMGAICGTSLDICSMGQNIYGNTWS